MRKSLWLLLFITSAAGYGYSENRKSSAAFRKEAEETAFQNNNDSLPNILDLIPAIEVHKDLEYGYHIFFLKQFHTAKDVEIQVGALVTVIKDENKKMNINP